MTTDVFLISGVHGARDRHELKRELSRVKGVISVAINREDDRIIVDYDGTGTSGGELRNKIAELGYSAESPGDAKT